MILYDLRCDVILAIMISTTIIISTASGMQIPIFPTLENGTMGEQPNIDASNIYDTHSMVLGTNVKNLIILTDDITREKLIPTT